MRCPFCNHYDTQVRDSRSYSNGMSVKRRRYCAKCKGKFTTFERREIDQLYVIKKNCRKEVFDLAKLQKSLDIASRKRDISDDDKEDIINNISLKLEQLGESSITSHYLGECMMNELKQKDIVSYIRYASVYKNFREVDDFHQFINNNYEE